MEKNAQTRIILVEDDIDLGEVIYSVLENDGYNIHFQSSFLGIEDKIRSFNPSILVFDVEVGDDDGINIASKILKDYPKIPILFISSHTESEYATKGVVTGGVGYLRKPFELNELKAYIDRFAISSHSPDIIGNFTIDKTNCNIYLSGKLIKQLTPLEFNTLKLLSSNRNNVITYSVLSREVWDKDYSSTEDTMNNLISRLRKLLAIDSSISIETVKSIGYRLLV